MTIGSSLKMRPTQEEQRYSDERDAYLALLADEYRTLSNSGNQTDRHTYTALQWGTALVVVIASASMSQWGKHDGLVEGAFLIVIPALVSFGMLYWIGEIARMRRIYDFICIVESKAELALKSGAQHGRNAWYSDFERQWQAERTRLLGQLAIAMPRLGREMVSVEAAPIEFERWLRRIRNLRASSNLSWVFMFRFVLFPLAIGGAWITGIYYLSSHAGPDGSRVLGIAAAVIGGLTSTFTTWLAAELASDLNDAKTERNINVVRRWLRSRVHAVLALPEWSGSSELDERQ
jgi:hypothetical protein